MKTIWIKIFYFLKTILKDQIFTGMWSDENLTPSHKKVLKSNPPCKLSHPRQNSDLASDNDIIWPLDGRVTEALMGKTKRTYIRIYVSKGISISILEWIMLGQHNAFFVATLMGFLYFFTKIFYASCMYLLKCMGIPIIPSTFCSHLGMGWIQNGGNRK